MPASAKSMSLVAQRHGDPLVPPSARTDLPMSGEYRYVTMRIGSAGLTSNSERW